MSRAIAFGAALLVCWGGSCLLIAQEPPAKENGPPVGGGLGGLRGTAGGGLGGIRAGVRPAEGAETRDENNDPFAGEAPPAAARPRTVFQAAQARGLIAATAKTDFETILQQPTKFNFEDTPLSEAIAYLADQHDIDIQLDQKGLTDAAVDLAAPVTRSLRKPISLESGLRLILEEFDLTFVIQDEVMKITSKERADEVLTTKVYPVGDMLSGRRSWGPLMNLITSTIQPGSWDDNGGPGSIQPFAFGVSLVISQKRDVHSEVRDLLKQLRAELPKAQDGANDQTKTVSTAVYHLWGASGEQTAEAIKKLVMPASWKGQGGEGELCVITRGVPSAQFFDMLLVRQSADVHNQISNLVAEFSERLGGGGKGGIGGGMHPGVQAPAVALPPAAPAAAQAAPAANAPAANN